MNFTPLISDLHQQRSSLPVITQGCHLFENMITIYVNTKFIYHKFIDVNNGNEIIEKKAEYIYAVPLQLLEKEEGLSHTSSMTLGRPQSPKYFICDRNNLAGLMTLTLARCENSMC